MESAETHDVKRMSPAALDQLTKPIAQCSSISLATSAALSHFPYTCTAVCFSLAPFTVYVLTFCVSFTLFRRQLRRLFSHPQQFFRSTSGHFFQVVQNSSPSSDERDSSILYILWRSVLLCRNSFKKHFVKMILPLCLPQTA